jgi:hypothetical protein
VNHAATLLQRTWALLGWISTVWGQLAAQSTIYAPLIEGFAALRHLKKQTASQWLERRLETQ